MMKRSEATSPDLGERKVKKTHHFLSWKEPTIRSPWDKLLGNNDDECDAYKQQCSSSCSLSSIWTVDRWTYRTFLRDGLDSTKVVYKQVAPSNNLSYTQRTRRDVSVIFPIEGLCLVALCWGREHEGDFLDVALTTSLASMIAFIPFHGVRCNPRYRGGGIENLRTWGSNRSSVYRWPLLSDHRVQPIPKEKYLKAWKGRITEQQLEACSSDDESDEGDTNHHTSSSEGNEYREIESEEMKRLRRLKLRIDDPEVQVSRWMESTENPSKAVSATSSNGEGEEFPYSASEERCWLLEKDGFRTDQAKWREAFQYIDFNALCLASTHIEPEQFIREINYLFVFRSERGRIFGACGAVGNISLFFEALDCCILKKERSGGLTKEAALECLEKCEESVWTHDSPLHRSVQQDVHLICIALVRYFGGAIVADNHVAIELIFRFTPLRYKQAFSCIFGLSNSAAPLYCLKGNTTTFWGFLSFDLKFRIKHYQVTLVNCIEDFSKSLIGKIQWKGGGEVNERLENVRSGVRTITERINTTSSSLNGSEDALLPIPSPIPKKERSRVVELLSGLWLSQQPLPGFDGGFLDPKPTKYSKGFGSVLTSMKRQMGIRTTLALRGGRIRFRKSSLAIALLEENPHDPWAWSRLGCAMGADEEVTLAINVCGGGFSPAATDGVGWLQPPSAVLKVAGDNTTTTSGTSTHIRVTRYQAEGRGVELALQKQHQLFLQGRLEEYETYDTSGLWNNLAYHFNEEGEGEEEEEGAADAGNTNKKRAMEIFLPEEGRGRKFTSREMGYQMMEEALSKRKLRATYNEFDTLAMLMSYDDIFVCKPWPKHPNYKSREIDLEHLVADSECDPLEALPTAPQRQKTFTRLDCCRMALEVTKTPQDCTVPWFHLGWVLSQNGIEEERRRERKRHPHEVEISSQNDDGLPLPVTLEEGDVVGRPTASISCHLLKRLGSEQIIKAKTRWLPVTTQESDDQQNLSSVSPLSLDGDVNLTLDEAECYALALYLDEDYLIEHLVKNGSSSGSSTKRGWSRLQRLVKVIGWSQLSERNRRHVETEIPSSILSGIMSTA